MDLVLRLLVLSTKVGCLLCRRLLLVRRIGLGKYCCYNISTRCLRSERLVFSLENNNAALDSSLALGWEA